LLPRSGKAPTDLAKRLEDVLDVKATAARIRGSFLRKVGIISLQGGICRLSIWTERWHETGDARIIAALLHSRCQFVGELLEVAREPKTSEELLAAANGTYGMGWDTQTQVANRRGWLQSTGMVEATVEGKIVTTPSGRALLKELALYEPGITPLAPSAPHPPRRRSCWQPQTWRLPRPRWIWTSSSTPSWNQPPMAATLTDLDKRFEMPSRSSGSRAEWLGGSGKTGKDDSYRVIVDCKTCGSGSLGDQQVDWMTLGEHKSRNTVAVCARFGS